MPRIDIMKRLRGKERLKVKLGIQASWCKKVCLPLLSHARYLFIPLNAPYKFWSRHRLCLRLQSFGMRPDDVYDSCRLVEEEKEMKRPILDLADNGGGYLQSAVQIANEFLYDNDMIVYTEGRRVARQTIRLLVTDACRMWRFMCLLMSSQRQLQRLLQVLYRIMTVVQSLEGVPLVRDLYSVVWFPWWKYDSFDHCSLLYASGRCIPEAL